MDKRLIWILVILSAVCLIVLDSYLSPGSECGYRQNIFPFQEYKCTCLGFVASFSSGMHARFGSSVNYVCLGIKIGSTKRIFDGNSLLLAEFNKSWEKLDVFPDTIFVNYSSPREILYGLKNEFDEETNFRIKISCSISDDGSPCDYAFYDQVVLAPKEAKLLSFNLSLNRNLFEPKTYIWRIIATKGDEEYASYSFFVNLHD